MKKLTIAITAAALLVALTGCSVPHVVVDDAPKPAAEKTEPAPEKLDPPVAGPEEGTREAPLPYNQAVTVYDSITDGVLWQVTVAAPFDGTADVAATNQFNEPPTAGNAYLAIPVHIVWQGPDAVTPWTDWQNGIDVAFVSTDGVTSEAEFVVQPWPALTDISDLYTGGAADFTTVVQVPAGVAGLVRVTASGFDFFVGSL